VSWSMRLHQSRERAKRYFEEQVATDADAVFWRHSPVHDVRRHPDHLLYGSWAGIMGSALLGALRVNDGPLCDAIASGLSRFQGPDGLFRMPSVSPEAMDGHDDEYFSFHCTNYALGAFDTISREPHARLAFLEAFENSLFLAEWLERRDWGRPWQEGNTVVNLASFFEFSARRGNREARVRLAQIADWLETHQNPDTGFWHSDGVGYLQAMAGAAHVLQVFQPLGRAVPRAERIVDSCLERGYQGIRAACADLDLVDILCHLRPYGHRVPEIDSIMLRYLSELLQIQNDDGGFCDSYVTPQVTYGLMTPEEVSITWTTWFRLATVGMIATTLVPEENGRWHFRKTLGTGYFSPPRAPAAERTGGTAKGDLPALEERRLALVRKARFLRQHVTWRMRQWRLELR
jgi:hypothetical protein